MKSQYELYSEIQVSLRNHKINELRHYYLLNICKITKRNVIIYFSNWMIKSDHHSYQISDIDLSAFAQLISSLNADRGLDLVLHAQGGDLFIIESICNLLKCKFKENIRIIIPQTLKGSSALIALIGTTIIMPTGASLGSITPQLEGISAHYIVKEYRSAKRQIKKETDHSSWQNLLNKHLSSSYQMAFDKIKLTNLLAKNWLSSNMLKGKEDKFINDVVKQLMNEGNKKSYFMHFSADLCASIGLRAVRLEDDSALYDAVMNLHTVYVLSANKNIIKIIDSNGTTPFIVSAGRETL